MDERCEDACLCCGKAATEEGDRAVEVEKVEPLSEIEQLRADLAYAQADARHWHEAWQRMDAEALRLSRQVREFARQAREGERLRVAVRSLEQNASAALIHWSGEDTDVIRAADLRDALDGERP